MKAALKNVKSGSVTYSIKDTDIDGVHVTKDYYMGIQDKSIVTCEKDKITVLYNLIENMVDEDSAIITVITGEGVTEEEIEDITNTLGEKYGDLDIDIKEGGQPVYSFFVGVE
jgi:dihydroxyacetone kinase-like predicted kinase